jgi:hypothetical protein
MDQLSEACALWQTGVNTGSSAIRAGARAITGIPHYFDADWLADHEQTARENPEVMDAARILLAAVAGSNPKRADASTWRKASGLSPKAFAGRGVKKKQAEDEQIREQLKTKTISMPLWGVSLDEDVARSFGKGDLGFLFQIEGAFRGVAAWKESGEQKDQYEIITGGNYTVEDCHEEGSATIVILRESPIPIVLPTGD